MYINYFNMGACCVFALTNIFTLMYKLDMILAAPYDLQWVCCQRGSGGIDVYAFYSLNHVHPRFQSFLPRQFSTNTES